MRSTSAGVSVAIHLAAVALMSLVGARVAQDRKPDAVRIIVPLRWRPLEPLEGGGGSDSPLPPSRGRLPPPPTGRIFVPPMMIASTTPKLPVDAAIIDAPDIPLNLDQYGDPLGKSGVHSGGQGHRGGIGGGCCGGVGDGQGPRYGGSGPPPGATVRSRYTTPPRLVYKIEPEYPDEARKARYEGTVVLAVEIQASGHPGNIRIVKSLGLGMDERAIDAVGKWRFEPARDSGRAVAAAIVVEVSFRLL